MFELTPQHPAILDGTSTFQLLLWQGCVRAGNRIKVHVEAASGRGGEQVRCGTNEQQNPAQAYSRGRARTVCAMYFLRRVVSKCALVSCMLWTTYVHKQMESSRCEKQYQQLAFFSSQNMVHTMSCFSRSCCWNKQTLRFSASRGNSLIVRLSLRFCCHHRRCAPPRFPLCLRHAACFCVSSR